jgi:hypothetical protein
MPEPAAFVTRVRGLDELGCTLGALDNQVVAQLRTHTEVVGAGGRPGA